MALFEKVISFGVKNLDKIGQAVGILSKSVKETDKEVENLNNTLEETVKVSDELGESLTKASEEAIKAVEDLNNTVFTLEDQLTAISNTDFTTALNEGFFKTKEELEAVNKALISQLATTKKGTPEWAKLQANIKASTDELNKAIISEKKLAEEAAKAAKEAEEAAKKAKELGSIFSDAQKKGEKAFSSFVDGTKKFITESKAYKVVVGSVSSFIKRIDDATGASAKLAKVTAGLGKISGFAKAGADATGLTKVFGGIGKGVNLASKAFGGLGKAIAATGLGLLVIIGAKLVEKLLQNEKVINALNKAFAILEGILNPLIDIIVELGEELLDAFSKPQETLEKIKKFINDEIIPIFTDLGKLIGAVFTGNFDLAGQIVDKFKKKAVDTYKAAEKAVKDFANKVEESVKTNLDLQDSIDKNVKSLRNLQKAEGELAKRLETVKAAVEDGTASFESRLLALGEQQELEKKLADNQIQQQKLILQNLKAEAKIKGDNSKETLDAIAAQEKAVADAEAAKIATVQASVQRQKDLNVEKTAFEIDIAQQTAESLADTEARKAERADLTIEQSLEASKKSFDTIDKFVKDSKAKLDASIPEQAAKIAELDALYQTAEQDRLDRDKGIEERRTAIIETNNADRLASAQKRYDEEAAATDKLITKQNEIITKSKTISQVEESRKAGVDAINTSYATQQSALDENYNTQIKINQELVDQLSTKENLTNEEQQQLTQAKKNIETLKGDYKKATEELQENQKKTLEDFNKASKDKTKELRDKAIADATSFAQAAAQVIGAAFQAVDAAFQNQISNLEKGAEAARQALAEIDASEQESLTKQQELQDKLGNAKAGNQEKILKQLEAERRKNAQIAKQKADEQKKLEEQEKKIKEAKKKAAIAQKAAAIIQNIINTALAITSLLASTPPTPANIALSVAAGVTGAVQTAIIAAQPIPEFAEGGFTKPGGKYQPAGIVHAGEWVAPKWMVESPVYSNKISELENIRQGNSTASYSSGYATGGIVVPEIPDFNEGFDKVVNELTKIKDLTKENNELTKESNDYLDVISTKSNIVDVRQITAEQDKVAKIKSLASF